MASKKTLLDKIEARHRRCCASPSRKSIQSFFEGLLALLFPEYADEIIDDRSLLEFKLANLKESFYELLYIKPNNEGLKAEDNTSIFFEALPTIMDALNQDAQAMYHGDPAAKSVDEVIRTYPGFYAIAAYRIAHQLYSQDIQIIPRSITEIAHSRTGIDIHPGASIGSYFCIDHGTGIVIGETSVIGNHVKMYQGVTLGALSVNKQDADVKRHPTIEDHVVLYAGATILGGDTVIGSRSVVGGNVWLTKSILPDSKVYYKAQMHHDDASDILVFKDAEG